MRMLHVGFAKADITPTAERQTIYHRPGQPMDECTPIRDRLYARATAFRAGDQASVWVTSDVLCVDTALRRRVAGRLAERGVCADNVALSATHTHTAASVVHFHARTPTPEDYLDSLAAKLSGVASDALDNATPATLRFGRTTVDLSVNRREVGRMNQINDLRAPTGLVDSEVVVARFESQAGAGLLVNYAAHPLTMSERVPQISADYPGRAVARLEGEPSVDFAQFLQGCAGNANVKIHRDEAESERVGVALAEAALAACQCARESSSASVAMASEVVRLPWSHVPGVEEAKVALERARAGNAASEYAGQRRLEWAESLWAAVSAGNVAEYAEVLVQAARVGDAVLVALPGEAFAEIGLAIKSGVEAEHVFVVAYANNCEVGYVPTARAFEEGGYEVDSAPYYYGLFQLSPECERTLVDAAIRAAQRV